MSFTLTLPDGTEYTYRQCVNAVFSHLVRVYVDPYTGDMSDTYLDEHWGARDVYLLVAGEHEEYGRAPIDDVMSSVGGYAEAHAFAKVLATSLTESAA